MSSPCTRHQSKPSAPLLLARHCAGGTGASAATSAIVSLNAFDQTAAIGPSAANGSAVGAAIARSMVSTAAWNARPPTSDHCGTWGFESIFEAAYLTPH